MLKNFSTSAIVVASALVLCSLVGCGGGSAPAPSGESDILKILREIQAQQKTDAATIKAQQKKIDKQDKLLKAAKSTVADADLDARIISNGNTTLNAPAVLKKDEQQMSRIHAEGPAAIELLRGRSVKAEICIVPPMHFCQPGQAFIQPQPMQSGIAPIPPMAPMAPMPPMGNPAAGAPPAIPAEKAAWVMPAVRQACH